MLYLTCEEVRTTKRSLEFFEKAEKYCRLIREKYTDYFTPNDDLIPVYETTDTPEHNRVFAAMSTTWLWFLGITGPKPRKAVFDLGVDGIYAALTEAEYPNVTPERLEEIEHLKKWLSSLDQE